MKWAINCALPRQLQHRAVGTNKTNSYPFCCISCQILCLRLEPGVVIIAVNSEVVWRQSQDRLNPLNYHYDDFQNGDSLNCNYLIFTDGTHICWLLPWERCPITSLEGGRSVQPGHQQTRMLPQVCQCLGPCESLRLLRSSFPPMDSSVQARCCGECWSEPVSFIYNTIDSDLVTKYEWSMQTIQT